MVSIKELLQIVESLLSHTHTHTHGTPSADENFFMVLVNSLCCLLKNDATAGVSNFEHNGTTDVAEPGSGDIDGVAPPIISRNDSYADLLENFPRISSVPNLLFDIAEDFENWS
jgi:hypothetical protein